MNVRISNVLGGAQYVLQKCYLYSIPCCQPVYIVTVHPCENYTLIEAIGIQCATPVLAKLMSPKDQMEFCQYDHFECTLFDLKTFTCKKRIRYLAKIIHVVVNYRLILSG